MRSDRHDRRCRPEGRSGGGAAQSAGHRRERSEHRRPARRIHHRIHLADAARRRGVRTQISAGHFVCAPDSRTRQAEIARKVGADAVAHGCTGKGNDQVRFELAYKAIAPEMQIIAPWREWKITSREDAIAYAREHNIPIEQTKKNIYSRDRNIWHLSHEGGGWKIPRMRPKKPCGNGSFRPRPRRTRRRKSKSDSKAAFRSP